MLSTPLVRALSRADGPGGRTAFVRGPRNAGALAAARHGAAPRAPLSPPPRSPQPSHLGLVAAPL